MSNTLTADVAIFSQLDSERFGIRVAKTHIVAGSLPQVLDYCREQRIDLLIARSTTSDSVGAQDMERHGFLLMDTLFYYAFDLSRKVIPGEAGRFTFRPLQPADRDQVRLVAGEAFKGYMGHYHCDARLDRQSCDQVYVSWAERSATLKSAADEVLVAECTGKVVGFGTLRLNSPKEAEGLLFAVTPEHQRRGVCRGLVIQGLRWSESQGAQRMVISTQVTNIGMQKVWCRLGFEPSHSYYTFHKWFQG
jgi:GNAT superfamily N-acetyltransferase